jgi:SSS family transporter
MKSFFAAGGAVPWSINGLSLFMSFFSAGTFVVWGAIAYQHGWVSITIQWAMCIAGLLIGLFIAPMWRKTGVLTAAEFIKKRLGKDTQQIYTYLFLVLALGYTGPFLYPVAKIVNVSTGFGIEEVIIFLGLMIILYTAVGGLWAVVVTDVLQFVILTAAVIVVIPLALDNAGGFSGFLTNAPDDFFNIFSGEYTIAFIIAFMFYNMVFIGGNWAYVQRYTTVKDTQSSKKVGYLFSALYVISPVIWMLPPMLYRTVEPDLAGIQNEGAYLLMVKEVLPVGMLGLMLGGMVFATASSVNTTLNMAAAVVTNDIFKQLRPSASDKKLMFVARLSTVLFGIGTIIVALLIPGAGGIVEVVLSVAALTGAPLYAPPIWALFSKWHTGKSITFITVLSLALNLFFKFVTPAVWNFSLERGPEMMLGVGGPLLMLLGYELWARYQEKVSDQYRAYKSEEEAQKMEEKRKASADDTSQEQNKYGLKVIGYSLAFTGGLILVISFIASKANLLVGAVGIAIFGIAYFVWRYARSISDKEMVTEATTSNT